MISQTFQFPFEIPLIEWLQQIVTSYPLLMTLFSALTEIGDATFAVIIIGFLYWSYDKECAIHTAFDLIGSLVFNSMIKNVFVRRRPYFDNPTVSCLKPVSDSYDIYDIAGQGFSFPSGHAADTASMTTSLSLFYQHKKILIIGSILVFLVCLSRIVLGVHYPTDVLVGAMLGVLCSLLIDRMLKTIGKTKTYLILILIGSAGFFFCKSNDYYSSYGLLCGFVTGNLFEERYVSFKNTRNMLKMILRVIIGGILFLLIAQRLKSVANITLLEGDGILPHLFRVFRYALASFIVSGLYPYLFRYDILKLNDRM